MKKNIILFLAILGGASILGYAAWFTPRIELMIILAAVVAILWIAIYIILSHSNIPEKESKDLTSIASRQLIDLQDQLIAQERMASIGALTAGIAHEIKNPLNFINNFSEITVELIEELQSEINTLESVVPKDTIENITTTLQEITANCKKINEHGKRAESIVRNMLLQSRASEPEHTLCSINNLLDEYYNLAYHGMRAQNAKFNAKIEKYYDLNLPEIKVSPQNMGRVFLNIINNALYAANEKNEKMGENAAGFMPTITIRTLQDENDILVKIQDNGNGIPPELRQKVFEPFFTTKPAGKGTGLGLPICYDIVVKEHGGKLDILSVPNEFTEFILTIPKNNQRDKVG